MSVIDAPRGALRQSNVVTGKAFLRRSELARGHFVRPDAGGPVDFYAAQKYSRQPTRKAIELRTAHLAVKGLEKVLRYLKILLDVAQCGLQKQPPVVAEGIELGLSRRYIPKVGNTKRS